MELIDYLAILGLVAGCAYLVLAVVAFNRSRARLKEAEAEEGRMILSIEDAVMLVEGESTDTRMRKLATICASLGRSVFAEDFNYSVESLASVDRAIVAGWGNSDEELNPQVILTFGAYVGEVLVRRTRGRWVSGLTEIEPATVLFLGPNDDTVSVSPFLLVREKFENMYRFDLSIAFTALEQKLKELKAA